MPDMLKSNKIKLLAIAKDEAAYLAEWIFHHLYFGFEHIEVLVNRTSDNSISIIDSISAIYKNVSYSLYDWVDLCPSPVQKNIQYIAYADSYQRALNAGYSHVFFLDIDELWTPHDFATSIGDYVAKYPSDASISFNWACELGVDDEFSLIKRDTSVFLNEHIKTLVNIRSKIQEMKIHSPVFLSGVNHILAGGAEFVPRDQNQQFHKFKPSQLQDAFIIHRMYRSEIEYVACLYRGNPNSNESIGSVFKDNRHGFKTHSDNVITIDFSPTRFQDYTGQFDRFVDECALADEIQKARDFVRFRSNEAIPHIRDLVKRDADLAKQLFNGCRSPFIKEIFSLVSENPKFKIDSTKVTDDCVESLGWAFMPQALTPIRFAMGDDLRTVPHVVIPRPDIPRIHASATENCGFKLIMSQLEHNSLVANSDSDHNNARLYIAESELVKTTHDNYLFYNEATKAIQSCLLKNLRDTAILYPIFIWVSSTGKSLAILKNGKTMFLHVTVHNSIVVNESDQVADATLLHYCQSENKSFFIKNKETYVCALLDGTIAYNRPTPKRWETFFLVSNNLSEPYLVYLDDIKNSP